MGDSIPKVKSPDEAVVKMSSAAPCRALVMPPLGYEQDDIDNNMNI
jgi:hypothetical protein